MVMTVKPAPSKPKPGMLPVGRSAGGKRALSSVVLMAIAGLCCLTVAGQTRTATADEIAGSGTFSGQLYTNKPLGLTMLAPGGWTFYTREQNQSIVTANRTRTGAGQAQPVDKTLAEAAANTQILFQASPPNIPAQADTALFSSGIERLQTPSTSDKYVEANQQLVLRAANVAVVKDKYPLVFGGVRFVAFDVEGKNRGRVYRQRYIMTVRRNIALFFVITLYDSKQDPIVDASLRSIRFGK